MKNSMKKKLKSVIGRTVSIFCVMILLLTSPVPAFAAEDASTWKQGDPRWGTLSLGNLCTVGNSGCLMTSIAILMATSGAEDASFTPAVLRDRLENGGYVSHAASIAADGNLNYAAAFSQDVSPHFYYVGTVDYTYSPFSEIRSSIESLQNQGYEVVVAVNYYGHYVAAGKVTADNVPIFDPGYSRYYLSEYDGGIMQAIYFKAVPIVETMTLPDGCSRTNLELTVANEGGSVFREGPGKKFRVVRRASDGTTVKAVGYTHNEYNHLWFLLEDNTYIYSENVKVSKYLTTSHITGADGPKGDLACGSVYILKGNISGPDLVSVTVEITDENGSVVMSNTDRCSGSYSLANSTLDTLTYINHLARGSYTVCYIANESVDAGNSCVLVANTVYTSNFRIV